MSEHLRTAGPMTRFILQGGPDARAAAGHAFGLPLPEEACRANSAAGRSALWLGPDEWLLLASESEERRVRAQLSAALQGVAHSLVDVGHRQVAIEVAGPGAAEILASGCPLDLDPGAFTVGMCTRTLLGKSEVVLWRRSAAEYHLEVGRSYSAYVLEFLGEAERGE